ncbi:UPF0489 protein C5orf22 homolog [Diaphorina citri]|jgi:hypothetical protein|uniref:UPF0489 protein C5orf22 homolog n=1 Tax=Diaphorina citri TaxID=121845 RepID=A0A1S3D8C8_DIACI|nr:UPF0489 protein C5orf22 homolog [Diaphorina citri]KAI5705634.1 hypothetical protein M8J75_000485 [Diaphorina citri]KAI5740850.1 hypothetical protein M8J76_007871 [Diaphorina citri]KAI5747544.1 hypothetical protein M8J77_015835 [Diaphorina citri]
MSLKSYKQIPIHVVEDHHDALPHIYRSMGARYLPLHHNTLVHFDSHPDLLIPQNLQADDVTDKYKLFSELSIENWIMPAVYAGHFDKIIWVKQKWCNQMDNGTYVFHVGKCEKTGKIKLTATNTYFVSEVLYAPLEDLTNVKEVTLIVVTFNGGTTDNVDQIKQLLRLENDSYVLDIDLDFFSTRNPFQELYKLANLYDRLKTIYKCDIPDTKDKEKLVEFVESRTKQLESLKLFFQNIGDDKMKDLFDEVTYAQLTDLVTQVSKYYTIVDWELIHDAGCTCDDLDRSLPHHVTQQSQLVPLIDAMLTLWFSVADQAKPPVLITISRSSEDDYCPPEQVDLIESHVLNILRKQYDTSELHLHYQDDTESE